MSCVTCLILQYFSTLPHKWHHFRKKKFNINYVFYYYLQFLSEIFLITKIINLDFTTNVHRRPSCNVPFILFRYWSKLNFLDSLWKSTQKSNFMKFFQWEMCCCMGMNRHELFFDVLLTVHFSITLVNIKFYQFCEKPLKMGRLVQNVSSKMKEKPIKFGTRRE